MEPATRYDRTAAVYLAGSRPQATRTAARDESTFHDTSRRHPQTPLPLRLLGFEFVDRALCLVGWSAEPLAEGFLFFQPVGYRRLHDRPPFRSDRFGRRGPASEDVGVGLERDPGGD